MTSKCPRFWDSAGTVEEVIYIRKANRLGGRWAIGVQV